MSLMAKTLTTAISYKRYVRKAEQRDEAVGLNDAKLAFYNVLEKNTTAVPRTYIFGVPLYQAVLAQHVIVRVLSVPQALARGYLPRG